MPYTVRKRGSWYHIVNKNTGKSVGRSRSKRKAHIGKSIRNRSHRG
jgi:hypothetical protein